MRILRRWSMLSVFLFAGAPLYAQAQAADPNLYWGAMLGVADYEETGSAGTGGFNMSTFVGRLGWQMFKALAVEARAGFGGSGGGDHSFSGATYELRSLTSVLAKLSFQPSADSETYLYLVGGGSIAHTDMKAPWSSSTLFYKRQGPSFGIGIDLFADRTRGINIEWIRYLTGKDSATQTDYHMDHFGVGYIERF